VFDSAARVSIPLRVEAVRLSPNGVMLDGQVIDPEWEANASALSFNAAEPGDHRLELELKPALRTTDGSGGFDLAIPRAASARFELTLPENAPPIEVPSARGGVGIEKKPRRLSADLGPADRLTVLWGQDAASKGLVPTSMPNS